MKSDFRPDLSSCAKYFALCAILAALIFMPVMEIYAQASTSEPQSKGTARASRISLGLSLQEWGNELGTGLQVTSPWFLHDKVAVRLGGSVLWKVDANWTPYYALRLGLVGGNFMRGGDIRLYGEGGFLFLFPASSFDSDRFAFGGYGHFGFEFFQPSAKGGASSYFIELGSNGTGAKTNVGTTYVNGFSVSTGLRVYL
jgi:hypothetical protein